MNVFIILYVLLSHWIADFLFQNDWMATNKSKNLKALITHTFVYSIVMSILLIILIETNVFGATYWYSILLFTFILFITHTIIDYITSRITTRFWIDKKIRQFFDTVGFDQWLHYVTIFISIYYIFL